MTKKKVLIYAKNIEKTLINLLNNIDYKNYEIDLYVEEITKAKKKISKKVNIIEYKIYKNKIVNLFYKIKFKIKKHNKYNSSILYTPTSLIGNYIVRAASNNRTLYILKDISNLNEETFRDYFIKRKIYEFNNIIFSLNKSQEIFLKYYPSLTKKTHVINAFINYKEIENLSKEKIEEKIKRTDTNLLLIEDLIEEKNNILNKLQLIKNLKNEIENIRLYIIGDGIDKIAYESYIEDNNLKDNIFLLGKKDNIYPYIKKCDYLFLTNTNNSTIALETFMLKTQIISTKDITDDIITKENIFYMSSINSNQLLKQILNNKEKKKIKLDFEKINSEKLENIINFKE